VYFHNFNFERLFASLAHSQAEVDESLNVIAAATKVARERLSGVRLGA
jgi:glutamate-1-semialdehyde aminotransferase